MLSLSDSIKMKRNCLLFLACVSVLLLQTLVASISMGGIDINADKAALLSLKSHIIDDPANYLANNWSTTAPVCSWVGVTCGVFHHRVTTLDLSHMGLNGTIPPQIGNLRFLAWLSLRNNSFDGSLPDEFARLSRLKFLDLGFNFFTGNMPPFFGNLTMLRKLCLSHNKFNGGIPQAIGLLTKVIILSLSDNNFSGSIPSSIGNCTLLKEMNFGGNNLTGAIPPGIGELSDLEILRINGNFLSGNIPSTVFNCSMMKAIAMYENCLSGSLPSTIGLYLPSLVELQLWGNQLYEAIPSAISNASKLTFLDLHDNLFTGFIPALGNLRHLQVVDLSNNHLKINEPPVPEQNFFSLLTNCKQLKKIKLSGNPLNATLPISVGNLSASLQQFVANSCNLKASIPREIGNLTSLVVLDIGNNDLVGTIPTTIGGLGKLQGLYLQGNKLQGTIKSDICHLESLVDLFLGGNKLFGSIPDCVGNLTTVRNLSLSSNNLTSTIPLTLWNLKDILSINLSTNSLGGSLPLEVKNLKVVIEIDLSGNKLSGSITDSIGDIKSLAYLSLAKNEFHGPIPRSLGGSISLVFLDLSCNNLSGIIPQALETLLYLKYFNVSSNRLQGKIPDGGPFANFSAASYLANSALCGAPRLQVPPCKAGVTNSMKKVLLKLILPITASTLLAYYLFMWLKWPKKLLDQFAKKDKRYSYLELHQATEGFTEGNLLGSGSSGSVYKGTLQDGMIVAIKVFNLEERSLRSFEAECTVMHSTRHRNLVRILCSCSGSNFKALVMEYMANGSLEKWLYTHNYRLDILQRLDIMVDVASAVKYLHYDYSMPIIHGDLKPSNILLDEDMIARVCDFSVAKLLDAESVDTTTSCFGTIGYVAPERAWSGAVSTRSDVYSFGIMLMETFTGKKPTDDMFTEEMSLRQWVMNSLPHEMNRAVDPFLLQMEEEHFDAKIECLSSIMKLALYCSAPIPHERPNIKQVADELNSIKDALLMRM